MAHQGRLAGPGKAHDAKNFPARDLEGRVLNANDAAEAREHLGFTDTLVADRLDRGIGLVPEDFPDALCLDNRFRHDDCPPPEKKRPPVLRRRLDY